MTNILKRTKGGDYMAKRNVITRGISFMPEDLEYITENAKRLNISRSMYIQMLIRLEQAAKESKNGTTKYIPSSRR